MMLNSNHLIGFSKKPSQSAWVNTLDQTVNKVYLNPRTIVGSTGIFVAFGFNDATYRESCIVKFDSSGNVVWKRQLSLTASSLNCVVSGFSLNDDESLLSVAISPVSPISITTLNTSDGTINTSTKLTYSGFSLGFLSFDENNNFYIGGTHVGTPCRVAVIKFDNTDYTTPSIKKYYSTAYVNCGSSYVNSLCKVIGDILHVTYTFSVGSSYYLKILSLNTSDLSVYRSIQYENNVWSINSHEIYPTSNGVWISASEASSGTDRWAFFVPNSFTSGSIASSVIPHNSSSSCISWASEEHIESCILEYSTTYGLLITMHDKAGNLVKDRYYHPSSNSVYLLNSMTMAGNLSIKTKAFVLPYDDDTLQIIAGPIDNIDGVHGRLDCDYSFTVSNSITNLTLTAVSAGTLTDPTIIIGAASVTEADCASKTFTKSSF